jgi:hypothetical protein
MQDPDLRPNRRAGCAALIHELPWNAPSSFFYGPRLPWPVVRGADVAVVLACATILLTS